MSIAVTGASGLLGRRVARRLIDMGGNPTLIARRPMSAASSPGGLAVEGVEVLGPPPVDGWYELLGRPKTLIHLAWSHLDDFRSVAHVEEVLPGHVRFLRDLIEGGLERLVVAGTCLEYGLCEGEIDESRPANPTVPYGIAKDALRRVLFSLVGERAFSLLWLRLFYVFAPDQPARCLFPTLLEAVRTGRSEVAMSPGQQVRDFVSADEVGDWIARLSDDRSVEGLLNCCSGRPVTVEAFSRRVIEEAGGGPTLALGAFPYAEFEPMSFWGADARLQRALARSRSRDE